MAASAWRRRARAAGSAAAARAAVAGASSPPRACRPPCAALRALGSGRGAARALEARPPLRTPPSNPPPSPPPSPLQFKTVAPLGDRVFVKVDAAEATSAGGILLPGSAQEKATAGVVKSAAPKAGALASGDRVVYSKYAGTEVKLGGDAYVLLKEEDVLGTQPGTDPAALSPLADRVLLRALEAKKETDGGVILASDGDVERPTLGEVRGGGARGGARRGA